MNIIETHGLTRRFGPMEAVHELNLTVAAGSVTALLGANGAGKTTTVKLLMNLLRPTSGGATVFGRGVGADRRTRTGADRLRLGKPADATVDDRAAVA